MEKEFTNGSTAGNIQASGTVIKCTDKEFTPGQMDGNTKEISTQTKNKDVVF
jgi:hypothetical protein